MEPLTLGATRQRWLLTHRRHLKSACPQLQGYLYLGSAKAAKDKQLLNEQLQITHILNVAGTIQCLSACL